MEVTYETNSINDPHPHRLLAHPFGMRSAES